MAARSAPSVKTPNAVVFLFSSCFVFVSYTQRGASPVVTRIRLAKVAMGLALHGAKQALVVHTKRGARQHGVGGAAMFRRLQLMSERSLSLRYFKEYRTTSTSYF